MGHAGDATCGPDLLQGFVNGVRRYKAPVYEAVAADDQQMAVKGSPLNTGQHQTVVFPLQFLRDLQQSGYGVVVSQRQTRISIGSHTFYQLWDQKGPVAVASVAVHFKGTVFQHPAHLVPFRKFSSGSLPCRLPRPVHAALPASLLRKLLWGRSPNWSRLRKLSVSAVADDGGHSPHIRRFYPEKALQS